MKVMSVMPIVGTTLWLWLSPAPDLWRPQDDE
jgi:hypothetical protein